MKAQHILSTVAALAALQLTSSHASTVSQSDPLAGGINYFWTVSMGANDGATFQHHVGAWSWEDDSLFSPGDPTVGWTHTSDWLALTLTAPTTLTLRLERQAGVPWPSAGNPARTASTASMFPSFTIWQNWDNDGSDDDTYSNRGDAFWAEDLSYMGHIDNSTASFAEQTWSLAAGDYSIALGSNAPADDFNRQGYQATLTTTTAPEPTATLLLLSSAALLGLRRRRAGAVVKNLALGALALLLLPLGAQAHLSYSGRDFGTFSGGEAPVTITNQTVSGSFGWADGTDADFGDSHRSRIFRFTLANTATVSITVQSIAFGTNIAGLLPGFSVYSGLAHLSPALPDHDFSTVSQDWLASLPGPTKEGVLNTLGDFKIGNDDGVTFADLTSFTFKGYAVDGTAANFGSTLGIVGDGLADGTATGSFTLPAGDYSFFVGGADYVAGVGAAAPFQGYGISTTVTATPEPTTTVMLALGLATLGLRHRRATAA